MSARTLALEYLKLAKQYGPPIGFGNTTIDDAIAGLEAETGEPVEPIDCQFQGTDGRWHSFLNDQHKDNTIASGEWPIRNLYTAPPPAVPQPKAGELSAQEIYDIAHRKCTRYTFTAQSTEVMYGFSEMHLLDFIAAINAKGAPA